jgi:Na+/proline symporter
MHLTKAGLAFIILLFYLLVLLIAAFPSYIKNRNFRSYAIGEPLMGGSRTGMSFAFSSIGIFTFFYIPHLFHSFGIWGGLVAIAFVAGSLLFWFVPSRRVDFSSADEDINSIPHFIAHTVGDSTRRLRIVFSVLQCLAVVFFVSACLSAFSLFLSVVFSTSYWVGILIGVTINMLFTFLNGSITLKRANIISMFIAIASLAIFFTTLSRDNPNISDKIISYTTHAASAAETPTPIALFTPLTLMLGSVGFTPAILHTICIPKSKTRSRARLFSIIICLVFICFGILIALFDLALLPAQTGNNHCEFAYVFLSMSEGIPPLLHAGMLCGAFAALLVAMFGATHCASASISWDIYAGLKRNPTDRELSWISRLMIFPVCLIALLLSLAQPSETFTPLFLSWSLFASIFSPALLLITFHKKTTSSSLLTTAVLGLSVETILSCLGFQFIAPILAFVAAYLVGFFAGSVNLNYRFLLPAKHGHTIPKARESDFVAENVDSEPSAAGIPPSDDTAKQEANHAG